MLVTQKILLEGGIQCVQCTSPALSGDNEQELADKYVRKVFNMLERYYKPLEDAAV